MAVARKPNLKLEGDAPGNARAAIVWADDVKNADRFVKVASP
jgi:hypothetical protein